jgi:hypothetical protein
MLHAIARGTPRERPWSKESTMRAIMLASAVALVAFAGCTSTYHPEYHPVTVTSYEQHVTTTAGTAGAQPGPVLSAPEPQRRVPPPPWSAWPSE